MSRIGKLPVVLAAGVTAELTGRRMTVKGPKGRLERDLPAGMEVEIADGQVRVRPPKSQDPKLRGLYGLTRTLIYNMVKGVTEGFEKHLEIQGVGYRAQAQGKGVSLFVGYSKPTDYTPPEGISIEVPKPTQMTVKGINKELVGAVAAELRFLRKPEPYKGKGIRYADEHVRRKVGKAGVGGKK